VAAGQSGQDRYPFWSLSIGDTYIYISRLLPYPSRCLVSTWVAAYPLSKVCFCARHPYRDLSPLFDIQTTNPCAHPFALLPWRLARVRPRRIGGPSKIIYIPKPNHSKKTRCPRSQPRGGPSFSILLWSGSSACSTASVVDDSAAKVVAMPSRAASRIWWW